jgi:predicted MPP superfamily phosphohydrolase
MSKWKPLAASGIVAGAGMLIYGAVVEAYRLSVEKHTLDLPNWPDNLAGFRLAVLADFHLQGAHSLDLAKRAIAATLDHNPDFVAIVGDVVGNWTPDSCRLISEAFEPLATLGGRVAAIPGNHDYHKGSPESMRPILKTLNIHFLRNESWKNQGITWVGVDSATESRANPWRAMKNVKGPAICLWHEPDLVHMLPVGCALMVSGHSHGGQFRFPGGFTPMYTDLGRKYPRGFYPDAVTPLYVSRGIGTTGPPSRFNCPPEVSILTLNPK